MVRPHARMPEYSAGGVRLAFGEAADGRIVHIGEVRSGLRCGCVCPHCSAPLVARRGPQREHHFGHHAGTACAFAAETALHKLAKQIFETIGRLTLPPAVAEVGDLRTEVAPAREVAIDAVAIERRIGAVVPDVICTVRGRDLLVEVAVTHRCPPEKIGRLRDLGLPAIEIDLPLSAIDRGLASVGEAIVRSAPRRWLHNVRIEQAREALAIVERRRALRRRDLRAAQVEAIVALLHRRGGNAFAEAQAPYGADVLVGIPIAGDASLCTDRRTWQSAILREFVVTGLAAPPYAFAAFSTRDVLDRLGIAGIIDPALCGYIDDALAEEVRGRVPHFVSPFRVVEAYLDALARIDIVVGLGRSWCVSDIARRNAVQISAAAAPRLPNE